MLTLSQILKVRRMMEQCPDYHGQISVLNDKKDHRYLDIERPLELHIELRLRYEVSTTGDLRIVQY